MIPPVYDICEANAAVKNLLSAEPRVYEFGSAPEGAQVPYVVWQTITGAPDNNVGDTPGYDSYRVQIDTYSNTKQSVINVAEALRDAMEQAGDIVSWNGEGVDPDTKEFTYSFDVALNIPRE